VDSSLHNRLKINFCLHLGAEVAYILLAYLSASDAAYIRINSPMASRIVKSVILGLSIDAQAPLISWCVVDIISLRLYLLWSSSA
jgi:hypothetical protein